MRSRGMVDVIFPCNYSISSPFEETDPIMTLRKRFKNDPGVEHFLYPTWKFNPKLSEAMLRKSSDPATFDRDIGCQPAKTSGSFIKDVNMLEGMLGERKNAISITRTEFANPKTGQIFTTGKLHTNWKPKTPGATILSLDGGSHNNSFAMSLAHIDSEYNDFVIDGLAEIQPMTDRPIHFSSIIENIISVIIETYNVKVLVTDRWAGTTQLMQDICDEHDVEPIVYSLRMKDFVAWRQVLIDNGITLPREEMDIEDAVTTTDITKFSDDFPISHFLQQCMSVRDTGKTVDKGKNYTDDLFRAVVLGWTAAQDPEIKGMITGDMEEPEVEAHVVGASFAGGALKKPSRSEKAADSDDEQPRALIVSASTGGAIKKVVRK